MVELSGTALLGVLRVADSALPTGMFTQSHSLESFVHAGRVTTPRDVRHVLEGLLTDIVGPADSVAVAAAVRAAAADELNDVLHVDRLLHATKLCHELRAGSMRSGGRLLQLGTDITGNRLLAAVSDRVAQHKTPGHYATVFGVFCAALDVPPQAAVVAELYSFASSFLGAAMRLLRFDHMDAQRTLMQIGPLILDTAAAACGQHVGDMRSFGPLVDIMSMHHERGHMRLFSS